MAIGRPTTITAVQVKRIAFMNVGGSVGPAGTRSKLGPVTHRIHTIQLEGENHTADGGPDFHRRDLGSEAAYRAPRRSVTR